MERQLEDPTLNLLRHYIHVGWPVDRRMLPWEIHTFWNYREDLCIENGLVYERGQTRDTFNIEKQGIGADTRGTLGH